MKPLFDQHLRVRRRDRAARLGPALFLADRVAEDLLDRIDLHRQKFDRALLIGCPSRRIAEAFAARVGTLEVRDPSPLLAPATIVEDEWHADAGTFDLVLALGTLDTVNDLPAVLRNILNALAPGGVLLAAMAGGDTLPRLRAAMRAADSGTGSAAPHVHPRIEASALAPLAAAAGFVDAVVDIDRVKVGYADLFALIADLRAMAATNLLIERPRRSLGRLAYAAAAADFAGAADADGRTRESFEILGLSARRKSAAE